MSHVRTQIRDRVAADLAGVATVYKTRLTPIAEASLPVLLVYTDTESSEIESFGALMRTLALVVEVVARGTAGLDTTLDDLVASVETALGADPTLNGLAVDCYPSALEVSTDNSGAEPVGRARVTFAVTYRTAPTDPTVSI